MVATGSALTYQWQKNGSDISGATSSSYTTPETSIADNNTAFSVSVSNSAGSVSSAATLTVLDTAVAATITSQPADQTAITGQTVTFSVKATGTSLRYQWQKNGENITDATSSSYTTPATSSADSGTKYSVSVSNSVSTVTSSTATLTVSDTAVAPTISSQPAEAQTVTEGQTATFLVKASGTSSSTSGRRAAPTSPVQHPALTPRLPPALGDSGAVFTVVVSNALGTVTSNNATLTVTAAVVVPVVVAPAITAQPAAQTVTEGKTATFSVTATGTSPSYQWKKGGTNIPGATSSTYTTPATSMGDSGARYSVSISNSAGSVTSNNATLTVTAAVVVPVVVAPAIATQPAAEAVTVGQMATFSVIATGTAPLGYQWKKGGTNISGANASSYTTPATSIGDSGAVFSVEVSNSAGSVTSSNATLTVTVAVVAPAIDTQPAAQTVADGQTATFSVTATGTSPGYQWKKDGTDISGATSSTYTTPATSIGDSGAVFSVAVSNSAGTVTSDGATLTVSAVAPAITTQPAAQTVTANQTATFTVTATGTAPLGYQWKKGGTVIPGATSNTYTTPAMSTGGSGVAYSVVVSNSAGSATSSSATLTVNKSTATGYSLVPNPSGGNFATTECVKENSTGLIWEGKTASPATSRLGTGTYTNYDSTSSAQKSDGTNPTQAEINASTNSIGYKNSVNTSTLCGYTDWRLPTHAELQGILASSGSPRIDTTWFPNTQDWWYWSSSPYAGLSGSAWVVNFDDGRVGNYGSRNNLNAVRLVRP